MTVAVEEVLALWREAERILDDLPAGDPRRALIEEQIATLRATYQRLTEVSAASNVHVRASLLVISNATRILQETRQRYESTPGMSPPLASTDPGLD